MVLSDLIGVFYLNQLTFLGLSSHHKKAPFLRHLEQSPCCRSPKNGPPVSTPEKPMRNCSKIPVITGRHLTSALEEKTGEAMTEKKWGSQIGCNQCVCIYIYDIFFWGILHAIQTTTRKTNIQDNSYLLKVLKSMWGSAFVALRQNMSAESREVMKRLQLRINILFNVFLQKHQGFYNHSGKSSTLRRFCTWPRPFCAEFTVGTAWRKTHGLAAPAYSGT